MYFVSAYSISSVHLYLCFYLRPIYLCLAVSLLSPLFLCLLLIVTSRHHVSSTLTKSDAPRHTHGKAIRFHQLCEINRSSRPVRIVVEHVVTLIDELPEDGSEWGGGAMHKHPHAHGT